MFYIMESFQKIVLYGAIIILIITLVIIGVSLKYYKKVMWPPLGPSCPDYWRIDGSGNNTTCTNVKDLGTCPAQSGNAHLVMNFNKPPYTGQTGSCAKYKWANSCSIAWDAVNYGVNNPCQTSSSSTSS